MPVLPCPHCTAPTPRSLNEVSAEALVNYYRCDKCGAVWNTPKGNPTAPPRMVTIPQKRGI